MTLTQVARAPFALLSNTHYRFLPRLFLTLRSAIAVPVLIQFWHTQNARMRVTRFPISPLMVTPQWRLPHVSRVHLMHFFESFLRLMPHLGHAFMFATACLGFTCSFRPASFRSQRLYLRPSCRTGSSAGAPFLLHPAQQILQCAHKHST